MKCTRNLTKHIQLLKEQHNKIVSIYLNGDEVDETTLSEYATHLNYVKKLFKKEKFHHYNKKLGRE